MSRSQYGICSVQVSLATPSLPPSRPYAHILVKLLVTMGIVCSVFFIYFGRQIFLCLCLWIHILVKLLVTMDIICLFVIILWATNLPLLTMPCHVPSSNPSFGFLFFFICVGFAGSSAWFGSARFVLWAKSRSMRPTKNRVSKSKLRVQSFFFLCYFFLSYFREKKTES